MKFYMYPMLALLLLAMPGCLNAGGKTGTGNAPAASVDLSGTYQGQDGTGV